MDDFAAPFEWLMELAEEQMIGFGVLCQLLMIGILGAAFHGSFLTPGTNPDAGRKIEQLVAGYQQEREGENAWPEFAALCESARKVSRQFYDGELAVLNHTLAAEGKPPLTADPEDSIEGQEVICPKCDPERRNASRRLVEMHRISGVFALQAALSELHRFVRPIPDGPLLDFSVGEIGACRIMTRVGAARMFIAHEARNEVELVAAVRDSLAASQPLAYQSTLLDRLYLIASRQFIFGELRSEIMESPPSAEALHSLLSLVERYSSHPSFELAIEGERLSCLDTIARSYTDDGNGDGSLIIAECDKLGSRPFLSKLPVDDLEHSLRLLEGMIKFGLPRRRESVAACNRVFDSASNWLMLSPHGRANSRSNPTTWNNKLLSKREYVVGACLPDFRATARSLDIHQITIDGTRLMLAIEIFKSDTGEYPPSLTDLVPDYLPNIPIDPFTGKPYIFRRLNPGEDPTFDQHRPYLLYSTGFDAHDDNARVHPDSFFAPANPDSEPGFDIVINQPR